MKDFMGYRALFTTSSGSIYYVDDRGLTKRLKSGQEFFEVGYESIFYINHQEFEKIGELVGPLVDLDKLCNIPIKITHLALGVQPLEINQLNDKEKIIYDLMDDCLVLKGTQVGDACKLGSIFGSVHVGHPVVDIYT